ncbi:MULTISPECIES: sialate O-acetylesterase [unclassified Saccharicrinis]|uniref:sialate O-acetylesterase n=1 Tax=unclassified Saccharicrinis TaxID=2646859 RepID=UPI003D32A267
MRLTFLVLAVFYISFTQAQTRDTLYLWPNKVPGELKEKQAAVVSNNSSGNVIRLAEVTNPAIIVYKPEKPNKTGASIIVCPGGGYNILAVDKEGYEVAEWLNTLGYTAFVLQYRVPQKQLGALNDIQRAIRYVRSKADIYNLNQNKIGVMGFSAGGSLCARASTLFNQDTYSKVDSIDQLSSRPDFSLLIYPAYLDKGEKRSITPELKVSSDTPPCFIFGTADDKYGNSSLVMAGALRDYHVPVELHYQYKGGHGYGLRPGNEAAERWPGLAEDWMKRMVNSNELKNYARVRNFPRTTEFVENVPKKENVWVFMMAGQSNMAGRGQVEPQDTIASDRVFTINKNNKLILAKEPLNMHEPTMKGLDCGLSFGKELLKSVPDSVSILLIHTAVGGSSIGQWLGDSIHRDVQLLTNFRNKVEFAKQYGTLKGILWHQGESDAKEDRIPLHKKRMTQLFQQFRRYADNKSLPIFIGELGIYLKKHEGRMQVNKQIKKYVARDRHAFIIHSSDLKHRGDNTHFNAESQRILGKRFAEEYLKSCK